MLKLISIHINKTAGTSFEKALRLNYTSVFRINTKDGNRIRRGRTCNSDELSKNIPLAAEVIHGHFKAKEVILFNVPIIAWVRKPVDRVISNYFYLLKNKRTELTLLDYAAQADSQNRMNEMLSGMSLDQFFFIGATERFKEDLKKLGRKLKWKYCHSDKLNTTNYSPVAQNIRNEIRKMNMLDENIYNEVLNKR